MSARDKRPGALRPLLEEIGPTLKQVVFVGVVVNVLALAPTLYMFTVYERVVNSRSHTTLVMLTVLVLGLLALMEALEWVRAQMLHRAGLRIETRLGERVFDATIEGNLRLGTTSGQGLSDLRTLREFSASPAATAILDAPVALVLLVLLFLIHPALGWLSMAVAFVQVTLAFLTERWTHEPLAEASRGAAAALGYARSALANAQVVGAMGMLGPILGRWKTKHLPVIRLQARASDLAGVNNAAAKFLQNVLSSGLLGLACWIALHGELSGGGSMMIVASMLGAKALAPLMQIIASFKLIAGVRTARERLERLLEQVPEKALGMPLPPPQGRLAVENVVAAAPGTQVPILRGVSFTVAPGQALVIVGPSAAGKSSLARLLVGIWPASSGKVRLDGVDVFSWDKAELGPHVGYLPESIELFDGSIAENIARFGKVDRPKVEAAARAVGLHEAIAASPDGYDTRIGDEGAFLSGGQRQRVALARAMYGGPRLMVLDEPNSSLDEAGEHALLKTLEALKASGITLIVITHRTGVFAIADLVLVLRQGQVAAFGPRDEVLAKARASANAALPVVAAAAA